VIFGEKGEVIPGFYVTGCSWSPAYCVVGREVAVFEAGFSSMGRYYLRDIMEASQGRKPSFLFITHVHYDHCGSASFLKKSFPHMVVGGSQRAKEIIGRENAVKLMRRLSNNVLKIVEGFEWIEKDELITSEFEPFDVENILKEGDVVEIEKGLHVVVMATPGHTRDHLSYYIPEREILICTEACGCLDRAGHLIPEFLVDYDSYLSSLIRLSRLPVKVVCQGHHFVFTDNDAKRFFSRSIEETERFREWVEYLLERESYDIERVVQIVKNEQYDTNTNIKQPEEAYLINLTTKIRHLSERLSIRKRTKVP